MKTANQLANVSAQAYDNFKAVAQNIASVNGVIAQLSQVANANAALGLFTATVNLNDIDVHSGNAFLFQQLLSDTLSNMGFNVSYQVTLYTTNVTIDWDPENQNF